MLFATHLISLVKTSSKGLKFRDVFKVDDEFWQHERVVKGVPHALPGTALARPRLMDRRRRPHLRRRRRRRRRRR